MPTPAAVAFGPFRLVPSEGLLLENEVICQLGGRAIEILIALVERAGEIVTKQELVRRVWPGMVVPEANLRVQISALRKALGDGRAGASYIARVTGRG